MYGSRAGPFGVRSEFTTVRMSLVVSIRGRRREWHGEPIEKAIESKAAKRYEVFVRHVLTPGVPWPLAFKVRNDLVYCFVLKLSFKIVGESIVVSGL